MDKYTIPTEYIVMKAREALNNKNNAEAETWVFFGRTLFLNNLNFHLEMYQICKKNGNAQNAANYFSELLNRFQHEQKLWAEVENLTAALHSSVDGADQEKQFLNEMFKHIPLDVQHQLLLMTADRCEDTMEHCHLLLLLFKKFPQSIISHGPRLVDTLLSAEKHSHASSSPLNNYRKLLVCELLPLLGDTKVELTPKLLFRLLHKGIEFYLYTLMTPSTLQDSNKSNEIWIKLFEILDLTGRHLGWDPYLTNIGRSWNRENYWQKILSFCQSNKLSNVDEHIFTKQLMYCLTILFLNSLYEYKLSLRPFGSPGEIRTPLLLIEAFVDPSMIITEPKSKRRKLEMEISCAQITVDEVRSDQVITNFIMASNCWDLLRSTDSLYREFQKLCTHLKIDSLTTEFIIDYSIYKCLYDEALQHLKSVTEVVPYIVRHIRYMCIYFCKKNYTACFDYLYHVILNLPTADIGKLSNNLVIGGNLRHLHYLPLNKKCILQYCVGILVAMVQDNVTKIPGTFNEIALGNLLILIQFDWMHHVTLLPLISDQIRQRGSFHYPLFQTYVVHIEILEEIMYLWADHGGKVAFDIFDTTHSQFGQRRIGTRGADKGVKEDFKQAMKRQIQRSDEPIDKLIIQFITQQRIYILQSIV